jgi:hypothetical protein
VRLLRSWPRRIPAGRAHVVDDIEHLLMDNHHYGPLAGIDDDVLLLEWDTAVGQEDLRAFATRARKDPDAVLVAPYRIYADSYGLPADVWAHRRWDGTGADTVVPVGATPVDEGEPYCQLFGLGMSYLPRDILRAYVNAEYSRHWGDTEFSMWHYRYVTRDVPIMWEVRPVHLHYEIPSLREDA